MPSFHRPRGAPRLFLSPLPLGAPLATGASLWMGIGGAQPLGSICPLLPDSALASSPYLTASWITRLKQVSMVVGFSSFLLVTGGTLTQPVR